MFSVPPSARRYVGLARAHQARGQWALAVGAWKRAVATDPDQCGWQLVHATAGYKFPMRSEHSCILRVCFRRTHTCNTM